MRRTLSAGLLCAVWFPSAVWAANAHYPDNRPPLTEKPLAALPVGAVLPEGWLRKQLQVQAAGMTGHLDEFWESLTQSAWKGGDGEGWERAPYYLDGLIPLAYQLKDERLIAKVKGWMDAMIASAQPNGWFGPAKNKDRWPLAVALKCLTQYYEATGDEKALDVIKGYCRFLHKAPPDWPDRQWRGVRAMEHLVTIYWLYARTGDTALLDTARSIHDNCFKWTNYFLDFPYPEDVIAKGVKYHHPTHVVNIAMAMKYPGIWYQQSKDERDLRAVYDGQAVLDTHHGQIAGRFSGDEHLSGRRPTQGTELCAVVEYMFSLEKLIETFADPGFSNRLEMLAYNANPGAHTEDYWAHQYDQQANQVLCSVAKRNWSTNDDTSNVYGLEPNYGCCTANMHQGWPKFVSHMWMATDDNGLALVAYGPNRVTAKVADGATVSIRQETDYPFDGKVKLTFESFEGSPKFPLRLYIPPWAKGAKITAGGKTTEPNPRSFATIERAWKAGDVVEIDLPMNIRTERRYNNAVSIFRGPLAYSLKIGEKRTKIKSYHDTLPVIDWQIEATTPWNYGLAIDPENPGQHIQVERRKIGELPFATADAPVVLKVDARRIPSWTMEQNSAGETPASPAETSEPLEKVELVPYGSTRLRISEFPLVNR